MHVTLVETDGTSWGAALKLSAGWQDITVPLADLKPVRGVKLPLGYPERWNYWIEPAQGRGAAGDRLKLPALEHVQVSLRPGAVEPTGAADASIDLARIELVSGAH